MGAEAVSTSVLSCAAVAVRGGRSAVSTRSTCVARNKIPSRNTGCELRSVSLQGRRGEAFHRVSHSTQPSSVVSLGGIATDCLRLCLHYSQRSKRRRVSCAASSAAFTPADIPSDPGRSDTPAADEESCESGRSDTPAAGGEQGGMAVAVAQPERLNGAVALIAGGTIGAGIIALPVKTVAAGFIPSTVALTCCWAYMALTACLIIELSSFFGAGTNVVTMAENTLGKAGKAVTIVLYTFIYCATLTAYIAEGAKLMAPAFAALGLARVPSWLACGAFTAVFGGFVYAGTGPAEKLNSVCLVFAIAAYATLVGFGMGGVDFGNLIRANWGATVAPLPIMVVAFTFHNMIPSLMSYLGCRKLLLKAVIWGSIIPLVFYTLWQGVIMGTIGSAAASLTSADQIVAALRASAGASAEVAVRVFSFFAIVTSFLGVALGCVDFMQGGEVLKGSKASKSKSSPKVGSEAATAAAAAAPKKAADRLVPMAVIITPALFVAVCAPTAFLPALEYSGTLRLVLFGMMPAIMVWKVRYGGGKLNTPPWVAGGKVTLAFVIAFASGIIGLELGGKIFRALARV